MRLVHLGRESPQAVLRTVFGPPGLNASGQHLWGDENVVLNGHAGIGLAGCKQPRNHDHRGLQPFRAVNRHDLNGCRIGLRDGLGPLTPQSTNLDHAAVHGGCIVTRVVADGLDNGHPGLGKLTLGVIWIGHEQVGVVEHGVKHVVQSAPAHELVKVGQERPNSFRWRMFNQMWQHFRALLERDHGLMHLPFGETDDG